MNVRDRSHHDEHSSCLSASDCILFCLCLVVPKMSSIFVVEQHRLAFNWSGESRLTVFATFRKLSYRSDAEMKYGPRQKRLDDSILWGMTSRLSRDFARPTIVDEISVRNFKV